MTRAWPYWCRTYGQPLVMAHHYGIHHWQECDWQCCRSYVVFPQ